MCDVLGLTGYASQHTAALDRDEVTTLQKSHVSNTRLATLFNRNAPSLTLVNESGLYTLVLKSRKPEAQAFRKWVTSVVLPAIRKDGAYVMGEEKVKTGEMAEDELIARALVAVQTKLKRLEEERERLLPAAQGYDKFLNTEGTD